LKFERRTVTTLGLALLFALGMPFAPANAVERTAAVADQIPVSVDVSAQPRAVGAALGALDVGCADYRLCIWDRADYGGAKYVFTPGDQGRWDATFNIRSAKNRYGDRAVAFYNASTGERVRCLNPTTNLPGPFPDATRILIIGADGSRC
jgi:hypothetical protein